MRSKLYLALTLIFILTITACGDSQEKKQNDSSIIFGKWDYNFEGNVGDNYPFNFIFVGDKFAKVEENREQYQFYSISPKVVYTMNSQSKEVVLPTSLYGLMDLNDETIRYITNSN
ncbi:hypothetical protein M3231_03550 [Neobacillus mesonae]|nr:hypothetical protein [Neobacillus mesonae]